MEESMRHTLILANHAIKEYENFLLQSKDFLFGVNVRPFDFGVNEKNLDKKALEIACYESLKTQTFKTIQNIILFPKTIQSLLSLLKELQCYGINISDLPKDTDLHKDIYQALKSIQPLYHDFSMADNVQYTVYHQGLSHAETYYLKSHGAQFEASPVQNPESLFFKVALNIRHEIEAVIQEILNFDLNDVVIAIPNLNNHVPLVESSFKRYGLNLSLSNRSFDYAKKQFIATMNLNHTQSLKALIEFLEANPLNLKTSDDLVYYISHFELTIQDVLESFDYVDETTSDKDMMYLQQRIQEDSVKLQSALRELFACDFKEALHFSYKIIQNNSFINLKPLLNFIETNHHLYSEETYNFFMNHLDSLSLSERNSENIRVVDINELPHFTCENLYVLNLGASAYPSISKRTGIIDEQYLSSIQGYPSLEERTEYQLQDQKRFFKMSKQLTLSYSSSTYEGKGIEVSYPIESFCETHNVPLEAWKVDQIINTKKNSPSLSRILANELYLKDGKIVGSISAFQKYLDDPYEFFIERALQTRKPERLSFDPRIIGTLNHSIVEHSLFGLDDTSWKDLMKIFPESSPRIQMIKIRNDIMMRDVVKHLKDAIADTDLVPLKRESWFDVSDMFKNIRLRGIIDRIDANNNQLIVIDYKSSKQSLSPASVTAGSQLQLLSYALIARRQYEREVLGVFYYGFRFRNINTSLYSYSFSKGLQMSEDNSDTLWLNDQKFSGWFFEAPETTFNSTDYFGGLRETKAGMTSYAMYDIEKVEEVLRIIYNDIQENILNGVLDKNLIKMTLEEANYRKDRSDT